MAHLPLVLDLAGVRCLVVGAGRVAERKITMLLRAGARVTVVAPAATERIAHLARCRRLTLRRGPLRPAHLRGVRLVMAATSDAAVNRDVARRAVRGGAFCNVADDAARCTFLVPSVLRRGSLLISVSTAGESPAIARRVRGELGRRYGSEYGPYLKLIGMLRRRLLRGVTDRAERERRYRRLLKAPVLRLLRTGRSAEARRSAHAAAGFRRAEGTPR
jgi:precorrin-2 dehydrogenase/sirohydrochlorin ferrochelatase